MKTLSVTVMALIALCCPMQAAAQQSPPPLRALEPEPAVADGGRPLSHSPPQQRGERYTKRGLVIGAIAGGVGGLAFGTFFSLLCAAEYDGCLGVIPVAGLIGAAGGGGLGAIIGSMIRRSPDDAADRPEPAQPGAPSAPPFDPAASVLVTAGYASATIHSGFGAPFEGSGPALRAQVAAELRPWIGLGPEIGHAAFGDGGNVQHAAVAVRLAWPLGVAAPYVVGNMGYYQTTGPSLEFLGGALGVGARVTPFANRRFFVDAEARWSRNTQNIEPMRMRTMSVGGGYYW